MRTNLFVILFVVFEAVFFICPSIVKAQNSDVNQPLFCYINVFKVDPNYTLPYKYDGMLLGNGTTLSPGDVVVMTQHISNNTGKRLILQYAEMSQMAGKEEPIDILGYHPMNGSCSQTDDKRVKCNTSYSFDQTLDGAIEYLVRINGSDTQPQTSSSFYFQTSEGNVSCTDYIWIKGKQPSSVGSPQNVRVTSYADSNDPLVKYANIEWDTVPYATKYNLYTVGASDVYFDTTPTNAYILKFNKTSSWYLTIRAVNSAGIEGTKSAPVTVAYPSAGNSLETPKNLRITQVETTATTDVRLVHLMWDPVPGATSYVLYQNAGTANYLDRIVDTNLAELPININSVFYYAVSAKKDKFESARSSVIQIDLKNTVVTPTPVPLPTVIPSLSASVTLNPTTTGISNGKIEKLEQDVKYLREELVKQQVRQTKTEQVIEYIKSLLKRWFRISF
jgi:hypothetical protein